MRKEPLIRTEVDKNKSKREATVMLATLLPDVAGNIVGRANAQAASRRITATINNRRLMTHLIFTVLDDVIHVLFPPLDRRVS